VAGIVRLKQLGWQMVAWESPPKTAGTADSGWDSQP
jgi:hypothetical protein